MADKISIYPPEKIRPKVQQLMDEINLINDLISRDFDTLNPDQQRIRLLSNFHTEVANGGWKQYGERWRDEGGGMKAEEGRGMKAEG